jgi:hypothetical protein
VARERKEQIKISVPPEVRVALEEVAAKAGRSISSAALLLLWDSLNMRRALDAPTFALMRNFGGLANDIAATSGGVFWHENALVRAALVEAISAWLEETKPGNDKKPAPPDYEPRAVGGTVARMRLRNRQTAEAIESKIVASRAEIRAETARAEEVAKKLEALMKAKSKSRKKPKDK